jgi:hypothetical protein
VGSLCCWKLLEHIADVEATYTEGAPRKAALNPVADPVLAALEASLFALALFAADAMASWFASWETLLNRSAHLILRRLGTSLGLVNPG